MQPEDLVGAWRLVSFEVRATDGSVVYRWDRQATGYLIYSADGHVCAPMSGPDQPPFAAGDIGRGTVEERAEAARTYIAYAGPYEVKDDRVVHHVEVSLFPNWIGGEQERFAELAGDRLILSTLPTLFQGRAQVGCLLWERAGNRRRAGQ